MNLNKLARKITLREGKKKQMSIAQIKEVMKLVFQELSQMGFNEVLKILARYK